VIIGFIANARCNLVGCNSIKYFHYFNWSSTWQPSECIEAEASVFNDDRALNGLGGFLALFSTNLFRAALIFWKEIHVNSYALPSGMATTLPYGACIIKLLKARQ